MDVEDGEVGEGEGAGEADDGPRLTPHPDDLSGAG